MARADIATVSGGRRDIAVYNPEQGLRSIATSRAAEQHWRRANDAKQLYKAVETKLKEQAAYVVWRDGVVTSPSKRGQGRGGRNQITALKSDLPAADPGAVTIHRWRKRLCIKNGKGTKIDAAKLRTVLEEAALTCQRVCEMRGSGTERGTAGTGEFERYTPAEYIEAAREMMGSIDLDPASSKVAQKTVKAKKYFTVDDDGLGKQWRGNVWLNPPYHRDLQPAFIDKMIAEVGAGHVTQSIMLTNNSTDTEWFIRAAHAATAICFTAGRVAFTTVAGEELAPTQGQAFFYFGNNVARFGEVFSRIGFGMRLAFGSEKDA